MSLWTGPHVSQETWDKMVAERDALAADYKTLERLYSSQEVHLAEARADLVTARNAHTVTMRERDEARAELANAQDENEKLIKTGAAAMGALIRAQTAIALENAVLARVAAERTNFHGDKTLREKLRLAMVTESNAIAASLKARQPVLVGETAGWEQGPGWKPAKETP